MTPKRAVVGLVVAAACAGVAAAVVAFAPSGAAAPGVPTTRVARGTLRLDVYANGDLRASRAVSLAAPPTGGMLRVVRLLETGTAVKAGDVVVEFDPADQQYALEQAESQLAEAEQEIVKMRADADVQAAADQVGLLTARFDVRRAELDARAGESLIGAIEAKKRLLALEEARRRLAQTEEDVQSRAATSRAALAVVEERRQKARLTADRAREIIASLVVRAPIDGLVTVKENQAASGGVFYSGMSLPEYRAGDTAYPGRPIADILAGGAMEIRVKVSELERDNVAVGHAVTVFADALPGRPLDARVAAVAGQATRADFFESVMGPARQFDVTLRLDKPEPLLRPGTSVKVVVTGAELRDALVVPRQALFQKDGKPIVYLAGSAGFEAREVTVTRRTESRVVIEGVAEGDVLALVNPDTAAARSAAPSSGAMQAGGRNVR